MLDFLVLGIIPGTHLQITFTFVLYVVALATLGVLLYIDRQRIKSLYHELVSKLRSNHSTQS